jgi:hypothetical protein
MERCAWHLSFSPFISKLTLFTAFFNIAAMALVATRASTTYQEMENSK